MRNAAINRPESDVAADQRRHYSRLYQRYGDDARALSHANRESQNERFEMLARVFPEGDEPFTVHEIGCALGHLGDFLRERYPQAVFSGSDVVEEFVFACRDRHPGCEFTLRDITAELPEDRYDFVVTCGLFHIPGNTQPDAWQEFVYRMLRAMYALATKGITVTQLTTYYDPGLDRPELFYQDEKALMDFTVAQLSRHFELDSAGPLYEYALRVYRPEYVQAGHPEPAFEKYFKRHPE